MSTYLLCIMERSLGGNAARMTNGQGHLYDDTKYPTGFNHFENEY